MSAHYRHVRGFAFIYSEMRASNLSLVIATGCYFLWVVGANDIATALEPSTSPGFSSQGPVNVGITPQILNPGATYAVTWSGCLGCSSFQVDLVRILTVTVRDSTVITYPLARMYTCHQLFSERRSAYYFKAATCPGLQHDIPEVCATGTVPDTFISTGVYSIEMQWSTDDVTTSSTFGLTPISGGSNNGPTDSGAASSTISASSLSSDSGMVPIITAFPGPSTSTTESAGSSSSASSPISAGSISSSNSSGLSTGAKVGIAIGIVGFALLILIAALLIWRRSRQRKLRALPDGMPYSHEIDSTNRDFTAEKEMHIINSPVDTLHNGYSSIPPVAETQGRSQRGSHPLPDDHAAAGAALYTDAHPGSYGSGYEDSASPVQESQASMQPAAAASTAIQRKPVGAPSGPTQHLREPGMSDEEVARLEEEERRLDEAIAEAERRRQLQG